ncbi:MAG TPA: hypothetical protein PKW76_13620 [bacterium]|nr:hypothetical protein [bacterium]HPG46710.1 hypothetical protein [bacterium]HPM98758.1 hypothetical protein [bacterium]
MFSDRYRVLPKPRRLQEIQSLWQRHSDGIRTSPADDSIDLEKLVRYS